VRRSTPESGVALCRLAASGRGALAVVGAGFLWNLVGGLVGAPSWLLAVSPFDHGGPLHGFDYPGGLGLLAVAVATGLAARGPPAAT
jgi:hypothetical protein